MSNILREKIARAIDPTLGAENDWAAQSADRILALPEIAEALAISQEALALERKAAALKVR